MATHQVRLKSRQEIAEGTMAFHFEKPPGFTFKAGQALACTLIDPPETDDEGSMRNFSIASAPVESDLMIATRMRDSAFKRVLKTMPLGTEVRIVGPFSSLTLRENSARPAVFLAGGIDITPFRSMLRQAAEQKLPHHLFLFYSNRRPEDAAFSRRPRKPPVSRRRRPKRIRWSFCKKRSARNNRRRSRKSENRGRNRLYLALHARASW